MHGNDLSTFASLMAFEDQKSRLNNTQMDKKQEFLEVVVGLLLDKDMCQTNAKMEYTFNHLPLTNKWRVAVQRRRNTITTIRISLKNPN
jgi:hypothetical protein